MIVCVPSCDPPEVTMQHNYWRTVLTVEISDRCPMCGGPRGTPKPGIAYDGSHRLNVDVWENPCGHVDHYADVIKEAEALAAKENDEYDRAKLLRWNTSEDGELHG